MGPIHSVVWKLFYKGKLDQSDVAGALSLTKPLDCSFLDQLSESSFYGADAQGRTEFLDIRQNRLSYHLLGRKFCLHNLHTVHKVLVSRENCPQKILHEWHEVLCPLMPAILGVLQCIVIEILWSVDLGFQWNIFAYVETVAIKEKCCKKATHFSISIIEWMDAKKVMNEDWNG